MKIQSSIISRGSQFIFLFIFLNLISEHSLYGMYSNKDTTNHIEFSYKESKFCANAIGVLYPTVNIKGGTFSYEKKSISAGNLSINTSTGKISKGLSEPGVYIITYKFQGNAVSFILTVNDCTNSQ